MGDRITHLVAVNYATRRVVNYGEMMVSQAEVKASTIDQDEWCVGFAYDGDVDGLVNEIVHCMDNPVYTPDLEDDDYEPYYTLGEPRIAL